MSVKSLEQGQSTYRAADGLLLIVTVVIIGHSHVIRIVYFVSVDVWRNETVWLTGLPSLSGDGSGADRHFCGFGHGGSCGECSLLGFP